jgi:hypothetical protein
MINSCVRKYTVKNILKINFFVLNTIEEHMVKNNRQNVCWGTKSMKIIDDEGKLNEEVVENLVKFYLQPPTPIDLAITSTGKVSPYLSTALNNLPHVDREFVHANVMDMFTQKNIQYAKNPFPEMYDWERIYKVTTTL